MPRPLPSSLYRQARALKLQPQPPLQRRLPPNCSTINPILLPHRSFRLSTRQLYRPRRDARSSPASSPPLSHNPLDPVAAHRAEAAERAAEVRRRNFNFMGALLSMAAIAIIVLIAPTPPPPAKSDAGPGRDFNNNTTSASPGSAASSSDHLHSLRATGTSSVPFFPRTIYLRRSSPIASSGAPSAALPAGTALPSSSSSSSTHNPSEELTLLGLGIRTVSFLGIQVYVVGLYVATQDLPVLQERMIQAAAPPNGGTPASALVAGEKEALRRQLVDPDASLQIWDRILQEEGIRSVVRIVPTRNTDFAHLRDGWVRGLMARSGNAGQQAVTGTGLGVEGESFDDEAFGEAVGQFKALFGKRGRIGKGKVLLLEREGARGELVGWVEREKGDGSSTSSNDSSPSPLSPAPPSPLPSSSPPPSDEDNGGAFTRLGSVRDERISRLIWLGYLAGKSVSSEGARQDVVEGVLELVERPLGTVETQVV